MSAAFACPARHEQGQPCTAGADGRCVFCRTQTLPVQECQGRRDFQHGHGYAATGGPCLDDDTGCCRFCGVSLTLCETCGGVGYHRDGCKESDAFCSACGCAMDPAATDRPLIPHLDRADDARCPAWREALAEADAESPHLFVQRAMRGAR